MKRLLPIFLVLILGLAATAWAGFKEGSEAYEKGDYARVLQELRPLAGQGHAKAQVMLGAMCFKGQGVPQDYVKTHMWFNLAAAKGNETAAKARDSTAELMTPAQIAEAQKLAREWKPSKE